MRTYNNLQEVVSEVARDLKELAVVYQSRNVQDLDVRNDPAYRTHELMNYSYSVPWQRYDGLAIDPEYVEAEFAERVGPEPLNPGEAWRHDEEYWKDFLHPYGEFSYTYSERMVPLLRGLIRTLKEDSHSRQAWLPIWWEHDGGLTNMNRVPCSLGYHFMVRGGKLYLHYIMRSCDFIKHFQKDVALAMMLQLHVAQNLEVVTAPGLFTHTIFSLHAFAKDLEGIF